MLCFVLINGVLLNLFCVWFSKVLQSTVQDIVVCIYPDLAIGLHWKKKHINCEIRMPSALLFERLQKRITISKNRKL